MLKLAFNALTKIHSRAATLKRLGNPDIFSPCRITPSNYSRFLAGPEYTSIKGVEWIIPADSLSGQYAQKLSFGSIPDSGSFKIAFGANTTADIPFNASAADIQAAVRLIGPLAAVVVTGSFLLGFTFTFVGFSTATGLGVLADNVLKTGLDFVSNTFTYTGTLWADPIMKGDRLVDGAKVWTVDDVVEMYDLGATVLGYRVTAN